MQKKLKTGAIEPEAIGLAPSTKAVFDQCSAVYLREDKHWGCDLDVIKKYVETYSNPEIFEVGTGPAWHLANLYFVSSSNIKRAVGIDYSAGMLAQARAFLRGILFEGRPLLEKVELVEADISNINLVAAAFDIGLLLNNTLGNLPGKTFADAKNERKRALHVLHESLRLGGYLIVSVNNADKLTEKDKYGDVFELDHDLSNLNTMDLVVRLKKTQTPYYSHWFTAKEVRQLLYEAGFRILQLEERESRFVVVGQKTGRGN
jgi:SAM-dependent methyltransferase